MNYYTTFNKRIFLIFILLFGLIVTGQATGESVAIGNMTNIIPNVPVISQPVPIVSVPVYDTSKNELSTENSTDSSEIQEEFNSDTEPPKNLTEGNSNYEPLSGWKFRANLSNTGEYNDGGVRPNGKKRWEYNVGAAITSSPVISDGVVYIGGGNYLAGSHNVYAFDAKTGSLKWKTPFKTMYTGSTPAVSDGKIYFGQYSPSGGTSFYALDAKTGKEIWTYNGINAVGSPTLYGGYVYIGCLSGKIFCLNEKTGDLKWVYTTGKIESSPAIMNGILYIADSRALYAIDAITGVEKWVWKHDGYIEAQSSPSVSDGIVYVGTGSKLSAINAQSGAFLWEFKTDGWVHTSPAVSEGSVYFGSVDKKLYKLNAKTGKKVWEFKAGDEIQSSPAIANGVVYFGCRDHVFYALDSTSGKQNWAFLTGGLIYSSPAVSNGIVYFGGIDGKVYAIGTGTVPTPGYGSLSITSNPDSANISLDGINTNKTTPSIISDINIGSHTITLNKSGYVDYSKKVTIQKQKTTKLNAILKSNAGNLLINSNPSGANILIDGIDTGYKTPKTVPEILAGIHAIRLQKSNYNDWNGNVTVYAKKTTKVTATLTSKGGENGTLMIYSNPSGATISLDGIKSSNKTPATLSDVFPGPHTITLSKDGFLDWSRKITVKSGGKVSVYGKLIRESLYSSVNPGSNISNPISP